MARSWKNIRHILDGEPVKSSVASRPSQALENNTEYLKELLDALSLGQAVILRNQYIESTLVVGDAVYVDSGTYKAALAEIEYSETSSAYIVAETSYVIGIIMSKSSSTRGDILLHGYAELDISDAVDGTLEVGPYYLSSALPGKLVKQSQPVNVYVLYHAGNDTIFVNPSPRGFIDSHVHYVFDLYAQPAGTPNCPGFGEAMSILVPDPSQQGWLPASHASFSGLAPAGAKFGYNIPQHEDLARVFPPFPLKTVHIEFNGRDARDLVEVDMNGIWWMEDCVGSAPWRPWDPSLSCSAPSTFPTILGCTNMPPEILEGISDPGDYIPEIKLWLTRFNTDEQPNVRSLQPIDGSGIVIRNLDGETATTGDLEIGLDLSISESETEDEAGYLAFKSASGGALNRGPVVESVIPGSSAIVLSSEQTLTSGGYVGNISLDIDSSLISGRQGWTAHTSLYNAQSTLYQDIPVVEFPLGIASHIRSTVYIPVSGIDAGSTIKFYLWLLSPTRHVLPTLTNAYRILPVPAAPIPGEGLTNEVNLVTTDTALADIVPPTLPVGPDAYIIQESEEISITAGDTIVYKLGRGASDSYPGDVILLRMIYKVILP